MLSKSEQPAYLSYVCTAIKRGAALIPSLAGTCILELPYFHSQNSAALVPDGHFELKVNPSTILSCAATKIRIKGMAVDGAPAACPLARLPDGRGDLSTPRERSPRDREICFPTPFKNSCHNSLDSRRDLNGAKHLRREMYAPFAPALSPEACPRGSQHILARSIPGLLRRR